MLHCLHNNPFRSPDWRWQRATGIVQGTQPRATRRRDDLQGHKWICRATRFLRALDACADDFQLFTLSQKYPALFWAHQLHKEATNPARWALEAHLLAREDNYDIGFRAGVAPEIVEAYESVFFNVREKLMHRDYILHVVLRHAIQRGVTERSHDLLWKLYGYFYGPHVLDAISSNFLNPGWCTTPETVTSTIQEDALGTLQLKAAVAAKTVPVTAQTQLALLDTFTKFVEIERSTDSADQRHAQILDHVSAMFEALPFSVGGRDPRQGHRKLPRDVFTEFDEAGVELGYNDLMQVAVGREAQGAQNRLKATFPDPIKARKSSTETKK